MSTAVGMVNNIGSAKVLCSLCSYRDGDMLSVRERIFPRDCNHCSLCGPKWSHAFNSASFKHNKLGLAVGRPIFAISPQDYARNDLRRSEIQNFPGGACPQTPLEGALRALQSHNGTPLSKILDPPLKRQLAQGLTLS